MIRFRRLVVGPICLCLALSSQALSQETSPELDDDSPRLRYEPVDSGYRSIRRDIPTTNAIRRAFDAQTRDLSGHPGANYWQLQTDFSIDVRLDRSTQSLYGSESILIQNNSPDSLDQIVLRLDHNIYRPRVQRGASVPAETTEGMVVTRLAIDGAEIPVKSPNGRPSGEGAQDATGGTVRGLDQTVATISLAESIPPHSTATLEVEWNTKLPGGPDGRGHRMTQRWDDTLFQPTQWFPRLAKYDDLRGWDTNPYLGPAEFYNNFGRFDVRINVPAGWIVTATGLLQNPEEVLTETARERLATVLDSDDEITIVGEDEVGPGKSTVDGDRLVWHYSAELVNDFAWATAENYVWKATRATIPDRGPIPIHMVFLPERASRFERAGAISRHALEYYSELWTAYPFPQLTLQDGPSAGMEYPMVINSNQGAADHEVAHQWWPMLLGTNETWYGWMDEGLNVYMNTLSNADMRGDVGNFDGRGQSYGRMSGDEREPSMMWTSNYGGPMYGFQTYSKTSLMLSMLGGIVGDDEVQRGIREYTEAWKFKHPSPWDFAYSMNNSLEMDLGWFWYYWLFTTESVDGKIESVESSEEGTVVVVKQDGQMPSPVVLKIEFDAEGPELELMDNAKRLEDGSVLVSYPVDIWFDGSRRFEAKLTFGDRAISRITLDPYGRFPDRIPSDNVWNSSN